MAEWQPIETAPENGQFMCWIVGVPWPCHSLNGHIRSRAHGILNELEQGQTRILRTKYWQPMPKPPEGEA